MITNADVEVQREDWKRRGYNNDQINELTKSFLKRHSEQSQPTANHTHPSSPPNHYDQLKTDQNGKKYSGMRIGAQHNWDYPNGKWDETKIGPCEWEFEFNARKRRHIPAPSGSGAGLGTQYHWYIVADQIVRKVSADEYETLMKGRKFKVGHKRPHWKQFSYKYPEQTGYTESVADYLRRMADLVEQGKVTVPEVKA